MLTNNACITLVPNALSTAQLRATIQKATDDGAVGQKSMQRLVIK
jgi:hypothetical protein